MISRIVFYNFRGIHTGKLERLRKLNVLVGPNNAGKSAILEAIYLAATANRPASLVISDGGRSESYFAFLPSKDMLKQYPSNHLEKRHKYESESTSSNRFNQEILQVTIPNMHLPIRMFELSTDDEPLTESEAQQTYLFRLQPPKAEQKVRLSELATQLTDHVLEEWPQDQQLVFCWQRELTYFYKGSASWWIAGQLPPAHHVFHYDMLNVQEHLPTDFSREMLSTVPNWTQEIAQRFGNIFGIPDSLTIQFMPTLSEPQAIQGWMAVKEGVAVPIDSWGDGARAAFKLLTVLVALAHKASPEQPGLLLWEEPEMFQNPQTLGKLLHEVVDLVRDKPIQIFMVSHSLEVVAHITQMLQEDVLSADETIAFLVNLRQGQLQSTWFEKDNLLSWLGSGLDPRVWGEFVPPVQFRLSEDAEEEE